MKKWSVNKASQQAGMLAEKLHISRLCADILAARGLASVSDARSFLSDSVISDPLLIRDMDKAAAALTEAVENSETICVYGDYDCDGITATVILFNYLECMGAEVCYYIPEREEGYGLNAAAIHRLRDDGVSLIVTVDNGISALEEAELIDSLGMRLVVTDHHSPLPTGELPKALAVVNPHRSDCPSPYKDLCGCAVALKLVAAMEDDGIETAFRQYADLAALATVADVVPLTGENRALVRFGLDLMSDTNNEGLSALIKRAKIKPPITSTTLAFGIAPRINASGRFGSPSEAAALLLSEDDDEAALLAERLDRLNTERKKCEAEIFERICAEIDRDPLLLCRRVLCFAGNGWHHGVIGIIAAKITERYGKPSFIASFAEEEARGSARSIEGFSIYDALSACKSRLTRFGGHVGAGGFSLPADELESFFAELEEYACTTYDKMPQAVLTAEKILEPSDLDTEAVRSLEALQPFGCANTQPVFLLRMAVLEDIASLSGGKHSKLRCTYYGRQIACVAFNTPPESLPYKKGDLIDIMAVLELNRFNGRESLSVLIRDMRRSDFPQQKFFAAQESYEAFMRGETLDPRLYPRICPTREELAAVFRAIPKTGSISYERLYETLASDSMNYCKLRLCIDIFAELSLIRLLPSKQAAELIPDAPKAELSSSVLLNRLKKSAGQ